jgi:hypothetical protein
MLYRIVLVVVVAAFCAALASCGGSGGQGSLDLAASGGSQPSSLVSIEQMDSVFDPANPYAALKDSSALKAGSFKLWAVDGATMKPLPAVQELLRLSVEPNGSETKLLVSAENAAELRSASLVLKFDPATCDPCKAVPGDFLGEQQPRLCAMQVFENGWIELAIGRSSNVISNSGLVARLIIVNKKLEPTKHPLNTPVASIDKPDVTIGQSPDDGILSFYDRLLGDANNNGRVDVFDTESILDAITKHGEDASVSGSQTWFMDYSDQAGVTSNQKLQLDPSPDGNGAANTDTYDDYYCSNSRQSFAITHYRLQVKRITAPAKDWTDIGTPTNDLIPTQITRKGNTGGLRYQYRINIGALRTMAWTGDTPEQAKTYAKTYQFRVCPIDTADNGTPPSGETLCWSDTATYTYDTSNPSFTGIANTSSTDNGAVGKGVVRVRWGVPQDLRYYNGMGFQIYAAPSNLIRVPAQLFNDTYKVKAKVSLRNVYSYELRPASGEWGTYIIGVRAMDNLGNMDTNTQTMIFNYLDTSDTVAPKCIDQTSSVFPKEASWDTLIVKFPRWDDHVYQDADPSLRWVDLRTWYSTVNPDGMDFAVWSNLPQTQSLATPPRIWNKETAYQQEVTPLIENTKYYIMMRAVDSYSNANEPMLLGSDTTYSSVDSTPPEWTREVGIYNLTWDDDKDGLKFYMGDTRDFSLPISYYAYYSTTDPQAAPYYGNIPSWKAQATENFCGSKSENATFASFPCDWINFAPGTRYYILVQAKDNVGNQTTNTNYLSIVTNKYDTTPLFSGQSIPRGTWYTYLPESVLRGSGCVAAAVYNEDTHEVSFMYFDGATWHSEVLDIWGSGWTSDGKVYTSGTLAVAVDPDGYAGIAFVSADPTSNFNLATMPSKYTTSATPATGEVYFTQRRIPLSDLWGSPTDHWTRPQLVHGSNVQALSLAFLSKKTNCQNDPYPPAIVLAPCGVYRDVPQPGDPPEPEATGQLYYYYFDYATNPHQWNWISNARTDLLTDSQIVDAHIIGINSRSSQTTPVVVAQESSINGGRTYFWKTDYVDGNDWYVSEVIPGSGKDFIQIWPAINSGEYYVYKSGSISYRNNSGQWQSVYELDPSLITVGKYIFGGTASGTDLTSEQSYQLFTGDTNSDYSNFKLYEMHYDAVKGRIQELVSITEMDYPDVQWKILPYRVSTPFAKDCLVYQQPTITVELSGAVSKVSGLSLASERVD